MTCRNINELMINVLYGEDVTPRLCFDFFEHLHGCETCKLEYLSLLETRERLSDWDLSEIPQSEEEPDSRRPVFAVPQKNNWWGLIQKVAASVLIVLGGLTIVQTVTSWPSPSTQPTQKQMTEMIHDVLVARQTEDWKIIGAALLSLKEEIDSANRAEFRGVYEEMFSLEQRYVQALEENNRQVRTLVNH